MPFPSSISISNLVNAASNVFGGAPAASAQPASRPTMTPIPAPQDQYTAPRANLRDLISAHPAPVAPALGETLSDGSINIAVGLQDPAATEALNRTIRPQIDAAVNADHTRKADGDAHKNTAIADYNRARGQIPA